MEKNKKSKIKKYPKCDYSKLNNKEKCELKDKKWTTQNDRDKKRSGKKWTEC